MERAGIDQNTESTSTPSWSHVVRGNILSQAVENSKSNSNSNSEDRIQGQGNIAHNNDMKRLQSPSSSTSGSASAGGLESEFWPALGQAQERPTTTTPTPSAIASTTFPIPSPAIQDKRASDVVGHRVSHKVAVSQGSERDGYVPSERNAPNRLNFSQGSETNSYMHPGRNLRKPSFSQGSETSGYVLSGRNAPNRPLFTQSTETNGYRPQGMNARNRSFFTPNINIGHSTNHHYRGRGHPSRGGHGNMQTMHDQRECPPRGGYGNMHNMNDRREYNYNWNSQQVVYGINNVAMYQQFCPVDNMRQPHLPQFPFVNDVTNQFYMNGPPMHACYFPQTMYLDASSGGPYFMPPLPPVPASNADLRKKIVKQVDYYFSPDNLCKDIHLRGHMDKDGWVAISVVAGFNKMRQLTYDFNLILDALGDSNVVELKGDMIRKQHDWFYWLNPDFIVGFKKEGHMDGSSSSETASEIETSERVFPEKETLNVVLNTKKR